MAAGRPRLSIPLQPGGVIVLPAGWKVEQLAAVSSRPINCPGCGAPLTRRPTCEYCGREREPLRPLPPPGSWGLQ